MFLVKTTALLKGRSEIMFTGWITLCRPVIRGVLSAALSEWTLKLD